MPLRVIVIVLDGVGIGALPDARAYNDEGSDTLGHVARSGGLVVPALASLGLGRLVPALAAPTPETTPARGAFGRMVERSPGKDSVTGHWELMGLTLDRPFPTFPGGFPGPVIEAFEAAIGRPILGNVAASGTAIIEALGPAHLDTGSPIVYTSADSVFQIAVHEDLVSAALLDAWCREAYRIVVDGLGVGRVIARPFEGRPGHFTRTARRHDYAMPPRGETLLDRLTARRIDVHAIGKIGDLFAGRGMTTMTPTASDAEGMDLVMRFVDQDRRGFIFANLVDSDTVYGHRNDVAGFARNLEAFDARLAVLLDRLRDDDILVVTADHGNDPATPSTDHSREYVPVLVAGRAIRGNVDLGTRETFADLGQTLADIFGVGPLGGGSSFLEELR